MDVAAGLRGALGGREPEPARRRDARGAGAVEAVVEERIDAGPYGYLRLDDGRWVVGLSRAVAVGQPVQIVPVGFLDTFHSDRTGLDFSPLWFGAIHPR